SQLDLPAARRTIAERDGICADHSDRQIRGNHLPGGMRAYQLPLEPSELRSAEDESVVAIGARGPVGAHVEQKHVEQGAIRNLAVYPSGLRHGLAHRHEFVKGAIAARRELEEAALCIAIQGDL